MSRLGRSFPSKTLYLHRRGLFVPSTISGAANLSGAGSITAAGVRTTFAVGGITVTDNFNRADGAMTAVTPGIGNWTRPADANSSQVLTLDTNQVKSNGGGQADAYWNADSFSGDVAAEITVAAGEGPSLSSVLILFLCLDPFEGGAGTGRAYLAVVTWGGTSGHADHSLYRINSWNSYTNLTAVDRLVNAAGGDVYSFSRVGNTIDLKQNGVSMTSYTDSSPLPATGRVGFGLTGSAIRLDNFMATSGGPALVLAGVGALSATGTRARTGAANLTGAGALVASGATAHVGVTHLAGAGALSAAGNSLHVGTAHLSGAGALTAAGTRTKLGAAALAGAGALGSSGTRKALGEAALVGTGAAVVTNRIRTTFSAAALSGVGHLEAEALGVAVKIGSAHLTGVGTLLAAGTRATFASSSLAGHGLLNVTGRYRTAFGTTALGGLGTLTAGGHRLMTGSAQLAGSGTLTASGRMRLYGTAALHGFGLLVASAEELSPSQPAPELERVYVGEIQDDDGGGLIVRGTTGTLSRV